MIRRLTGLQPADAAARLRSLGGLAFLDSAMRVERLGRYSYVAASPFATFTADPDGPRWQGERVQAPPLDALRHALATFRQPPIPGLPPFQGGAIGVVSYEFGVDLQGLTRAPAPPWGDGPDACLLFYDVVLAFDHEAGDAWLISSGWPEAEPRARDARAQERAELILARLAAPAPRPDAAVPIPRASWMTSLSPDQYRAAVGEVVERILDGEIFQANVARRYAARLPAGFDPWPLYLRLRTENPAPFAAYLDHGSRVIASSSPELLATVAGDRVEARPIKGTARRCEAPDEDRAAAEGLLASVKDRAENMMIVDLLRNDLSRVCRPGSVATPTLCGLESYAGLHHLVSAITGRLRPGLDAIDLLGAAFPGGSITGAPKSQAMQVIGQVEGEARGIYCGSVAFLGFDGTMAANIAIRTLTVRDGWASFQAGGGITLLSDPDAEHREALDKAERILRAFEPGSRGLPS